MYIRRLKNRMANTNVYIFPLPQQKTDESNHKNFSKDSKMPYLRTVAGNNSFSIV